MTNAAPARQLVEASSFGKDLGGHTISLALVDPAALANSDTCSILTSLFNVLVRISHGIVRYQKMKSRFGVTHVLEKIKRFMQVYSGRGCFRVAQLGIKKLVYTRIVFFLRKRARTRTAVTPHMLQMVRLAGEVWNVMGRFGRVS